MVRFPLLAFAKAIVAPVDSDDYPVDSVDEAAKITITLCLLCLAGIKPNEGRHKQARYSFLWAINITPQRPSCLLPFLVAGWHFKAFSI